MGSDGKAGNGLGWVRLKYGRGDMVLNKGAYFVSIKRWGNTNALEKAWKGWKTRPDYTAWRGAPIGEGCYWTEDDKFHGLIFRRGFFHVVVTCGTDSDHAGLFRLAEVIDAKIAGRPIPKAEEEEAAGSNERRATFQDMAVDLSSARAKIQVYSSFMSRALQLAV